MSTATPRTSGSSSAMRMVSTGGRPAQRPVGRGYGLRRDAGEGLKAQHVLGPGLRVPLEGLDLLLIEILLPLATDGRPLLASLLRVVHAQLDDVQGHLGLLY